jgi:hypothetical protein
MNDCANTSPARGCQRPPPSLDELAERVRDAHAGVSHDVSNAVMHAINGGQALIAAKAQKDRIPHGQWGRFLERCDVGERQAERYMRLARLAESNPTCKLDLAGLTIEAAIKKLSPPKPHTPKEQGSTTTAAPVPKIKKRATHFDLIAAWNAASPNERTKAIDSFGLKPLLAAIPDAWWPLIERHLADHHPINASAATP